MSDNIKQAKRDLKKLLARYLGNKLNQINQQIAKEEKKLQQEEVSEILLNKNYKKCQHLRQIMSISKTEDSKLMKTALRNLRNRGLNEAISEFTEITQLGAFLHDLLPEKEGGVYGRGKDYEESKYI